MEDAGHQDTVPRRGLLEVRPGEESGGDNDVDVVFQSGNESLEFSDRNGEICIQEEYRIVGTFQDAGFDGGAFAKVFFK